MTPLHHLKRSLVALLALGLILLVSLFVVRSLAGLGSQPAASPPENAGQATTVAGVTSTALGQEGAKPATSTMNPPTAAPAAAGKRPPACTFPLADIQPVESQPETYIFSEPKVVLTSQTPLGVAGWLPDGEHLLITRDLPNSARQSIEVLNVLSGETAKYAERDGNQKPLWLPGLQAVVYDAHVWSNEKSPSVERVELWMSRGPDSQPEKIASDIFSTSVSLDGNQVFFFSPSVGSVLQTWSVNTQKAQPVPLNMEGPIYSESRVKLGVQKPNQLFWISQSNNRWIALHIEDLLFLADTHNGYVCEVDLGEGWNGPNLANNVAWSTDGRYLAMTISSGYPGNVAPYRHILILDVATGEQYQPDLKVPYVDELSWAPDTHTLAVLGLVDVEEPGQMGLFLLDIDRKYVERVLPDWRSWTSLRGTLSWRPDGQALTLHCSTRTPVPILEFRICVAQVSVQK